MSKLYWHFTPLWSRKKMQFYADTVGLGQSRVNKIGYVLTIACMYLEIICILCSLHSYLFMGLGDFILQCIAAVAVLIVNLVLVGDIYNRYYKLGYTIWFAIDSCMSLMDTCDIWLGTKEMISSVEAGWNFLYDTDLMLKDYGIISISMPYQDMIPCVPATVAIFATIDTILIFGILVGYIMTHWKVPKPAISKRQFKMKWREYKLSLKSRQV